MLLEAPLEIRVRARPLLADFLRAVAKVAMLGDAAVPPRRQKNSGRWAEAPEEAAEPSPDPRPSDDDIPF